MLDEHGCIIPGSAACVALITESAYATLLSQSRSSSMRGTGAS
jgi:hypothetical protein